MKKYLMTVMAAVALGGLFSACSSEIEGTQPVSAEFDIVQNYEKAFITRFGQPHENQTWGFGENTAGTRSMETPYVSPSVKTYNAEMAQAWGGVNSAKATGSNSELFKDMNPYAAWDGSGWTDQFYDVHGTVEASELTDAEIAAITKVIVGENGKPGLIPESGSIPDGEINNLSKAVATGYSIVTTGGPVTLTPVYHNSNSGDRLSYYYYPVGSKPSVAEIKTMKKYSLGEMSDPQHYGNTHIYKRTYSLVYQKPDGSCTYEFPKDYVINFVISNTFNKEGYNGTTDKIYKEGGITTTIPATEPTLTSKGIYALAAGETIQIGTDKTYDNDNVRVRFGKQDVLSFPKFSATQQGNISGTNFNNYFPGNDVNGSLIGGSTCYYFRAINQGYLRVGVHQNGGTLKVYESKNPMELSSENNWSSGTFNQLTNDIETPSTNDGFFGFPVKTGYVYAVFSENGKLGFYGYNYHWSKYNEDPAESNPLPSWGASDCGTIFDDDTWGYHYIDVMLGKKQVFGKTKNGDGDNPIANFPALTEGTGIDGSLTTPGATVYYIRCNESGVMKVNVKLSKGKTLRVIDLGAYQWHEISGTPVLSKSSGADNAYYGPIQFNVESTHVYAIYAEASKLGYYGCEFLTRTGGSEALTTTSEVVWENIYRTPDYYSDGDLNEEVHSTTYGYGVGGYGVTNPKTSHTAVYKSKVGDVDYTFVGFEDWVDFDYNDVIFAVTGTEPEKPQEDIKIPDPEPEPEENTDPDDIVCRIIVEDLSISERSDFDFNDVVFDVCHNGILIIRAIGGELPIYIGEENANEVHEKCSITLGDTEKGKNSYMFMRNTGWTSSGGKASANIDYDAVLGYINLGGTYNTPADAQKIGIWVHKNGKNIKLQAPKGKVASMVCVGTDYKWCRERQDIDDKYHKGGVRLFREYVIGNPDYQGEWKDKNAWYHKMNQ